MDISKNQTIEIALREAIAWLRGRTKRRYTERFAACVQEDAAKVLPPDMKEDIKESILEQYGRQHVVESMIVTPFTDYWRDCEIKDTLENEDCQLSPDEVLIFDRFLDAYARTGRLLETLTRTCLDKPSIERAFTQTFEAPYVFAESYLAQFNAFIHVLDRRVKHLTDHPPAAEKDSVCDRVMFEMYKMQRQRECMILVNLKKTNEEAIPRIFYHVLQDMYIRQ